MSKNCMLEKCLDQNSNKLLATVDDKFGMLVLGRILNHMATGGWKMPATNLQPSVIANSFLTPNMSNTEKRMAIGCCLEFVSMGAATSWTIAKWRAPLELLCQKNLSVVQG